MLCIISFFILLVFLPIGILVGGPLCLGLDWVGRSHDNCHCPSSLQAQERGLWGELWHVAMVTSWRDWDRQVSLSCGTQPQAHLLVMSLNEVKCNLG